MPTPDIHSSRNTPTVAASENRPAASIDENVAPRKVYIHLRKFTRRTFDPPPPPPPSKRSAASLEIAGRL